MALTPLSRSRNTGLAGSDLDVRGWDVRTDLDDEKVGSVDDMLIDDAGRPRYLDVDLGLLKKHVLVPIGQARADDAHDVVWVNDMTRERLDDIPAWNHDVGTLDRGYEDRLSAAYRGRSASAGGSEAGLSELDDLDGFHIPKDEPNPKGWTVVAADGQTVGEVDELIVDTSAMMVRYLDCDLDEEKLGFDKDRERHVLIPLQQVRLDRDDEQVLVDGLTSDRIKDLPVYGGLPIASDFEQRLQQAFGRGAGATGTSGREDVSQEERRFYGERLSGRAAAEPGSQVPVFQDREPVGDRTDRESAQRDERSASGRQARSDDREQEVETDEHRMADDAERAASGTGGGPAEEAVRIRVRGDEIIVERRPKQ